MWLYRLPEKSTAGFLEESAEKAPYGFFEVKKGAGLTPLESCNIIFLHLTTPVIENVFNTHFLPD